MLATEREILHRLLTCAHPQHFEDFFKYFEEPERIALSKMTPIISELHLCLDDLKAIFDHIHYSWFIEPLEKLSYEIQASCLRLFSSLALKGLCRTKIFKKPAKKKNSPLDPFYIQHLLREVGYPSLFPLSCLPPSESLRFLQCSKKQLVMLIQHLGILEMANISKKIVDRTILNRIEKMFDRTQRRLFRNAKRTSEPKAASVRDIHKVLIDKKNFFTFLELRGIERMARGIILEHPTLIWHIAHILDHGRGEELLERVRRFVPNPYTPFFNKQIIEACESFKVEDLL